MPNVQPPFKGELRSFKGIRRDPHAPQNLIAERELFSRRWNHPSIRRFRAELDRVQATTRPYRYPRSTMFGFCLAALLFAADLHTAHRRVQTDPALRQMLGLPSITPETERRLAAAEGRGVDVIETGFPSRQLISEFVDNWLRDREHLMELLRYEAYDVIPGQAILKGGVQTSRIGIDGTRLQSPYKGKRGHLRDPGSRMMGRDGEKGDNQRWKMTAILLDVPFIVGSVIATPTSEITLVKNELVPQLKQRSDRLRAEALARHGKRIQAFHRAAIAGDRAFGKDPLYEVLYDHDFYGVFTPPEFPERIIEGKRLSSYKRGSRTFTVELRTCNDGTHYCECQFKDEQPGNESHTENNGESTEHAAPRRGAKPARGGEASRSEKVKKSRGSKRAKSDDQEPERVIMQQEAGAFGKSGYVKVYCTNPLCKHRNQRMYVPFREADIIRDKGLREAGPIDYTRVNPIWRGDPRALAINFLGCQTIEQYHQQRYVMFSLGSKDRRSGRRFVGNQANQFWHTFGDLLWNITVDENFARVKPEHLNPARVFVNMLFNNDAILAYKDTTSEDAETERKARGKRQRFKTKSSDPPTDDDRRKDAQAAAVA